MVEQCRVLGCHGGLGMLNMTCVLIVYSSLFARRAFVVKPQNLLLASCHVVDVAAQLNQLRRALEHKMETGQEDDMWNIFKQAAVAGAVGAGAIAAGPMVQQMLSHANL